MSVRTALPQPGRQSYCLGAVAPRSGSQSALSRLNADQESVGVVEEYDAVLGEELGRLLGERLGDDAAFEARCLAGSGEGPVDLSSSGRRNTPAQGMRWTSRFGRTDGHRGRRS